MKKRILLLALLLAFTFVLSGCGGEEEAEVEKITIMVSIDFPDSSNLGDLVLEPIDMEEGKSAVEALEAFTIEKGIPLEVENDEIQNVLTIGDTTANEQGYWMYMENGEEVLDSPFANSVQMNNSYEWKFVDYDESSPAEGEGAPKG